MPKSYPDLKKINWNIPFFKWEQTDEIKEKERGYIIKWI